MGMQGPPSPQGQACQPVKILMKITRISCTTGSLSPDYPIATGRPVAISLPRRAVLLWPIIVLFSESQLPERSNERRSNVMSV
jgi:hypothetical protein